jgi:carbon monoxide dehydrogenase subunit G
MVLKGSIMIRAPREKMWGFLTDLNQIGPYMSAGVEKIEIVERKNKYHWIEKHTAA